MPELDALDTLILKGVVIEQRRAADAWLEKLRALPDTTDDVNEARRRYLVTRVKSAKANAQDAERLLLAYELQKQKEGK